MLAKRHQLEEYDHRLEEKLASARTLQRRVNELSKLLEVEPADALKAAGFESADPEVQSPPALVRVDVESKRDKLEKLRREADDLEQDILTEEQKNVAGPHRRATAVPREGKPN